MQRQLGFSAETSTEFLGNLYAATLGLNDFDERVLPHTPESHRVTPIARERNTAAYYTEAPQTPMTMVMELNNWLRAIVADTTGLSEQLKRLCGTYLRSMLSRMVSYKADLHRLFVAYEVEVPDGFAEERREDAEYDSYAEQVCRLYLRALEALLVNEEEKEAACMGGLLENEYFHRSLMACATESVLLVKDVTTVAFE